MTDMIVQVAKAICLAESYEPLGRRETMDGTLWEWELRIPAARAAIEAIQQIANEHVCQPPANTCWKREFTAHDTPSKKQKCFL